ncbi:hypothetical protein BaRGS_00001999, partial [Batillaria attramentaria]
DLLLWLQQYLEDPPNAVCHAKWSFAWMRLSGTFTPAFPVPVQYGSCHACLSKRDASKLIREAEDKAGWQEDRNNGSARSDPVCRQSIGIAWYHHTFRWFTTSFLARLINLAEFTTWPFEERSTTVPSEKMVPRHGFFGLCASWFSVVLQTASDKATMQQSRPLRVWLRAGAGAILIKGEALSHIHLLLQCSHFSGVRLPGNYVFATHPGLSCLYQLDEVLFVVARFCRPRLLALQLCRW